VQVTPKQFLELLARLPARVWLQAAIGLIGFAVLAVLGFAVIAGVAGVVLLLILGFKAKAWLRELFAGKPPAGRPPTRTQGRVIDAQYEVVEKKDDERR
jgi:hypothetical protein